MSGALLVGVFWIGIILGHWSREDEVRLLEHEADRWFKAWLGKVAPVPTGEEMK